MVANGTAHCMWQGAEHTCEGIMALQHVMFASIRCTSELAAALMSAELARR